MATRMDEPISVTHGSRGPRLRLTGCIDMAMAGELHQAARALADLPGTPAIDCRRLGHLSGAALQVLLALDADLASRGRALCFLSAPPPLQQLLAAAGLAARVESARKNRKG